MAKRKEIPPLVTLHRHGVIGLNRAAAEILLRGIRETIPVSLSWDREKKLLLVYRSAPEDKDGFKLRVYHRRKNTFMYLIVAPRFFKASKGGLRVPCARRFRVETRGETLIIDRTEIGERVTRPELRAPRATGRRK